MSEVDTQQAQPAGNKEGPKRKGARPFIPIDERRVEALAAQGLSDEQIAAVLGIDFKTLWRRKKRFAEFRAVMERGKALGITQVANVLFQKATVDKDVTAMIFFLKCRAKWQDRVIMDVEHHVGGVSDEDLRGLLMSAKQRKQELLSGNGHAQLTEIPSNGEAVEFFEEAGE